VTSEAVFTPSAVDLLRQTGTEADTLSHPAPAPSTCCSPSSRTRRARSQSTLAGFGMTYEGMTAKIQQARATAAAKASRRETSQRPGRPSCLGSPVTAAQLPALGISPALHDGLCLCWVTA